MNKKSFSERLSKYEDKFFIGAIVRYLHANFGFLLAFLLLFAALSIFADNFFSMANFMNVLRTQSTYTFLAIGVMMALILGGIDLSGSAMLAFSGCVCVVAISRFNVPIYLAIIIGLVIGAVIGFASGAIIAYSGIHPFVVTLAMQSICRGAAYLIAGGQPVTLFGYDQFSQLGNGNLWGIPLPVYYMVIFLFLAYLLLNKTRIGRHVYAVGGNSLAAQFSGINIKRVKIMVWTISGTLSAFGGLVLAARMTSGQPALGISFETDAIAACVVGGVSMYGGVGTVGGMFIGILIMGMISNGLNLLHVNSYWQYVVKGIIILLAVYIDMYRKNKESSKK